jgi:hypothetical protein
MSDTELRSNADGEVQVVHDYMYETDAAFRCRRAGIFVLHARGRYAAARPAPRRTVGYPWVRRRSAAQVRARHHVSRGHPGRRVRRLPLQGPGPNCASDAGRQLGPNAVRRSTLIRAGPRIQPPLRLRSGTPPLRRFAPCVTGTQDRARGVASADPDLSASARRTRVVAPQARTRDRPPQRAPGVGGLSRAMRAYLLENGSISIDGYMLFWNQGPVRRCRRL